MPGYVFALKQLERKLLLHKGHGNSMQSKDGVTTVSREFHNDHKQTKALIGLRSPIAKIIYPFHSVVWTSASMQD